MGRMKQDMIDEFLKQPYIGVIATLRRDGRPYTVPVFWLWKEGGFWLTGTATRVWCKQLVRDPRCSLCIETTDPFPAHLEVDGRAEPFKLPDFDIWPIHQELADKYIGRGSIASAPKVEEIMAVWKTEPRMLFRITPAVWRAIELRVYRGKRADREYQTAQSSRVLKKAWTCFDRLSTNGKSSAISTPDPFALSLSKPVLSLSKGVNAGFFSSLLDVSRPLPTRAGLPLPLPARAA